MCRGYNLMFSDTATTTHNFLVQGLKFKIGTIRHKEIV